MYTQFHTLLQTNVLQRKTHAYVETPHPKSLPKIHYSYPANAPKCCLRQWAKYVQQKQYIAQSLESNVSVQILNLQLSNCMTPISKCLGFLTGKMRIIIIILVLRMEVAIKRV